MCPVKAGQIIYELGGVPEVVALKALARASKKIPFKSCFVKLIF